MRTLIVSLPLTEREIFVANDQFDFTIIKMFEAIEPMVNEWTAQGILDVTSGMIIFPSHNIFIDKLAEEFTKLDFITKIV